MISVATFPNSSGGRERALHIVESTRIETFSPRIMYFSDLVEKYKFLVILLPKFLRNVILELNPHLVIVD